MEKVYLTINGKTIVAEKGKKLLWVALENDIYIPHLCAIEDGSSPFGACRLCFVEIQGRKDPVTSCTEPADEGLIVETRTEQVLRLVRMGFEMILSRHPIICKECPANRQCALQDISREMGFKLKSERLPQILPELPVDDSHPLFQYNPNLCVLCGRCVHICNQVVKKANLDFSFRGFQTQVGTFQGRPFADSRCDSCLQCVEACPVGALSKK